MASQKDKLSEKEIKRIADLAHLYLTEENSKNFSQQFTKIFEYVNLIETIETQNVKNVRNTVDLVNVFRKDENNKEQMLSQDEALYCAPAKNNGYFLVKSIF